MQSTLQAKTSSDKATVGKPQPWSSTELNCGLLPLYQQTQHQFTWSSRLYHQNIVSWQHVHLWLHGFWFCWDTLGNALGNMAHFFSDVAWCTLIYCILMVLTGCRILIVLGHSKNTSKFTLFIYGNTINAYNIFFLNCFSLISVFP